MVLSEFCLLLTMGSVSLIVMGTSVWALTVGGADGRVVLIVKSHFLD